MTMPQINFRMPEPKAARDLIANGKHGLGFTLSLVWVISSILGPLLLFATALLLLTSGSTDEGGIEKHSVPSQAAKAKLDLRQKN